MSSLILLSGFVLMLVGSTALMGIALKGALRLIASEHAPFERAWLTAVLCSVASLFIQGIGRVAASYAGASALGYGLEILAFGFLVLVGMAIVASRHELAFWRAALVYLSVQAFFFVVVLGLGLGIGLLLHGLDSD